MCNLIFSRQNLLRRIVFLLMVPAAMRAFAFSSICTEKPNGHANVALDRSYAQMNTGYEMTAVHWDPVLRQNWAVVRPCQHDGAPAMLVPLNGDAPAPTMSPFPLVHAGEVVRIRQQDAHVWMELTGVAEESGAIGGRVRVHMLNTLKGTPSLQDGWGVRPKTLLAIIRGPHDVEIVR